MRSLAGRVVGLAFACASLGSGTAFSQGARLLGDLNQDFGTVPGSRPRRMASVGNVVVFVADTPLGSLWRTDGSREGTYLLVEGCEEDWRDAEVVGVLGSVALFRTGAGCAGAPVALWRTDGTVAGTSPIEVPGRGSPLAATSHFDTQATNYRGRIFFTARNPADRRQELWRTDATSAGTEQVATFTGVSVDAFAKELTVTSDRLLLRFSDSLWRSDGTAAGTTFVDDLSESDATFVSTTSSHAFVELWYEGLFTYFLDLMSVDGRSGSLRSILPPGSDVRRVSWFVSNEKETVFVAQRLSSDLAQLWRSDGTMAGTSPVTGEAVAPRRTDIRRGSAEPPIALLGPRTFFLSDLSTDAVALYSTDGTPETVRPVEALGERADLAYEHFWVRALGGRLFFPKLDAEGLELWASDGTPGGGRKLVDACPGPCDGRPARPFVLGARIFWSANESDGTASLWTSDGTPEGTVRLLRGMQRIGDGDELREWSVAAAGERWLFPATDFVRGEELWGAGPARDSGAIVSDLLVDTPGLRFRSAVEDGGRAYLSVESTSYSDWKLATTDGVSPLQVVFDPDDYSGTPELFPLERALVTAHSNWSGPVYALDRVTGVSTALFGLSSPGRTGDPVIVANLGGTHAVFWDQGSGKLWLSDGTDAGTEHVATLPCGYPCQQVGQIGSRYVLLTSASGMFSFDSQTRQLSQLPGPGEGWTLCGVGLLVCGAPFTDRLGRLYYELWSQAWWRGTLWRSDGTPSGTEEIVSPQDGALLAAAAVGPDILYSIRPGNSRVVLYLVRESSQTPVPIWVSAASTPSGVAVQFVALEQGVLFEGWDPEHGFEAWFAAPSVPSVERLTDFPEGTLSSLWATSRSGRRIAYFGPYDPDGQQLWRTDGTVGGTVRLGRASTPLAWSSLVSAERLFYLLDDGVHGGELWTSDGTLEGTHLVADLVPGAGSSQPQDLAVAGPYLYFSADDGIHGREIWVTPVAGGEPCRASQTALCFGGGRFRAELHRIDPAGRQAAGQGVSLDDGRGLFWFFTPELYETLVAIEPPLDDPAHHRVSLGSTSNVHFELTIADRETGATRRYSNPEGNFASFVDPLAFGRLGSHSAGEIEIVLPVGSGAVSGAAQAHASSSGICAPAPTRLCLLEGQYSVELAWRDADGHVLPATADRWSNVSGLFSAVASRGPEWIVKLLDARSLTGHLWLFYGGSTDLPFDLTVVELATGRARTYSNPAGELPAAADFTAF